MARDISIETGRIQEFSIVDYVVFGISLGFFALVGIYHAVRDRMNKRENTEEFLLGGRSMSILPVSLSLTVTFLSALTILGNPAEIYNVNTMFIWIVAAALLSMVGAGVIFIPFFYRLGVTSTFQYLEWRFDSSVRILGSAILVIQALIYMAFVLYAPCLAFSAVTGLNIWGCIVGIGAVATFYTALGGMKAVLWTDALQFFVMMAGILAVLIKGCMETGGFSAAWKLADSRGRVVLDNFSFDPTTRHSVWSLVIGGGFMWTSLYGINQAQVQRCLSTPSVRKAQLAILLNTPTLMLIMLLSCLCGVLMFAFYADCDPVSAGIIEKSDQLLILFVMDILGHLRGVPGIFVSCVFSGSLSSLSSSLNAIAAVTFEDFIKKFWCPKLDEKKGTIINKLLVFIYGLAAIGLAFLASQLGNILQGAITVYGVVNGPLFGLFVLAIFVPWCNKWGAIVGTLASLLMTGWIGIGYFVKGIKTFVKSPLSTEGCGPFNTPLSNSNSTLNFTTMTPNTTTPTASGLPNYEGLEKMYTLSYLYYTLFGVFVALIVGVIVSFMTGPTKPSSLDPRLICPVFDVLFPCLPECILKPLRFGINHEGKYEKSNPKTIKTGLGPPDHMEVDIKYDESNGKAVNGGEFNLGYIADSVNTKL